MTGDELVRWTGWDLRGGKNADPSALPAFVRAAPEDPASGGHYELLAVTARGFRPPQLLGAHRTNRVDSTDDSQEPEHPGLRQVWSLLYRQVAETAPPGVAPYAIYLLGVDPPPDATEDDLAIFNDFYTNVHLPEVANRRGALRAVRYELVEVVRPPYPGAPRFLAAYELDETSAANRRHTGPPYSSGPDVWRRHTTPWRLWYRRLDPHD
jgi:hypothetical protein